MPIDRLKPEPSNKKAFLSPLGKKLLKKRESYYFHLLQSKHKFTKQNQLKLEELSCCLLTKTIF